jgi:hypothetical protein
MSRGHLVGDVPGLFVFAIVLAVLTPRRGKRAEYTSIETGSRPAPATVRKAAV